MQLVKLFSKTPDVLLCVLTTSDDGANNKGYYENAKNQNSKCQDQKLHPYSFQYSFPEAVAVKLLVVVDEEKSCQIPWDMCHREL